MNNKFFITVAGIIIFSLIVVCLCYKKYNASTKDLVFINLYGGGWYPITLKVNSKKVDVFLNGITEMSSLCNKGINTLSIEGKWENTEYINETSIGVRIFKGHKLTSDTKKLIFAEEIIRDGKNPKDLSVSFKFTL